MYNYLKQFLLFLVIFLLWQCGQGTDPVVPTAVQAKRLLTGNLDKGWVKVSSYNQESEKFSPCALGLGEVWNLKAKDSLLTINHIDSCNTTPTTAKFFLDTLRGQLRLRFVLVPRLDTVTRIITYITDKEFIAEYTSLSAGASGVFVETFNRVDQ